VVYWRLCREIARYGSKKGARREEKFNGTWGWSVEVRCENSLRASNDQDFTGSVEL